MWSAISFPQEAKRLHIFSDSDSLDRPAYPDVL